MKRILPLILVIFLIFPACSPKTVIEGTPSEIFAEMHNHVGETVTIRVKDAAIYSMTAVKGKLLVVFTDSEDEYKPNISCLLPVEGMSETIEGSCTITERFLELLDADQSMDFGGAKWVKE